MLTFLSTLFCLLFASFPGGQLSAKSARASTLVPGTQVSIEVPEGFATAVAFAGFQHLDSLSKIMVSSIPVPYARVSTSFQDPVALKQQGMTLLSSEKRSQQDKPGLFIHVYQVAQGLPVEKWIWVFGSEDETVLVSGICLEDALEEMADIVRDAVLTASWDPSGLGAPLAGLWFTLEHTEPLLPVSRMANTLTFSEDGKPDPELTGKALFMMGPAVAQMHTPDIDAFALSRVEVSGIQGAKVSSRGEIETDGLDGIELSGECLVGGEPSAFYQAILREGSSYWIAQGFVRKNQSERFLPIFRKATRSLKRDRIQIVSTDRSTQVTVPGSWVPLEMNEGASIQVGHTIADCYVMVLSELKSSLEGMTVADYAVSTRENLIGSGDAVVSRDLVIHGQKALQAAFPATAADDAIYVHTVIDGTQHFHQIVAWMMKEPFTVQRRILDEVIESFRER